MSVWFVLGVPLLIMAIPLVMERIEARLKRTLNHADSRPQAHALRTSADKAAHKANPPGTSSAIAARRSIAGAKPVSVASPLLDRKGRSKSYR